MAAQIEAANFRDEATTQGRWEGAGAGARAGLRPEPLAPGPEGGKGPPDLALALMREHEFFKSFEVGARHQHVENIRRLHFLGALG